jgi:hypothetical protein
MVYFHAGKTNCPASVCHRITSIPTVTAASIVEAPACDRGLDGRHCCLLGAGGFGAGPVRVLNAGDAPFVPTTLTDLALHKGTGRALKWFGRSP